MRRTLYFSVLLAVLVINSDCNADPVDSTLVTDTRAATETDASATDENINEAPVNGHWGIWSSWSCCSKTCGPGVKSRTRPCNDPTPRNCGGNCPGSRMSFSNCEEKPCSAECTFDDPKNPMCQWSHDSSSNRRSRKSEYTKWIRHAGRTPSKGTGPSGDHTSGSGYYVYGDASFCPRSGQYVRLQSAKMRGRSYPRCLRFYYHANGPGVADFNVYIKDAQSKKLSKLLFSVTGNQGNKWKKVVRQYTSTRSFRFVLEMTCNRGRFKGDVAVDDIKFYDGKCPAKERA